MGTTDNGYSAPPLEGIRACGWDGAFAAPGVKDWDPVWDCFQYLMKNFDERVEWLRPGWCWGYAFRANANNPNALSRHSGAIAVDLNAPLHPNGVATTRGFTSEQIVTVNKILDEVVCTLSGHGTHRVLRWGGDYTGTPDAMHFEINAPKVCVANAAQNLRNKELTVNEQDLEQMRELFVELLQPVKDAGVRQTQRIMQAERRSAERDIRQGSLLRALAAELLPESEKRRDIESQASDLEERGRKSLSDLDEMEKQPEH